MKRKTLWLVSVLAFIVASAAFLTACGNKRKFYYTIERVPEHCSVDVTPYGSEGDGKAYVQDGETVTVYIYVESGFYADGFKMSIDGNEVELNSFVDSNNVIFSYSYSFNPNADFTISFDGEFKPIKSEISFAAAEFYNANLVSDAFIRFDSNDVGLPTTALAIPQFEVATRNFRRELAYGEKLEFYVFTDGYNVNKQPTIISCDGFELKYEFYRNDENNEYGVHYVYTQGYDNKTLEIGGFWNSGFSIAISESESMGNNITSNKLQLEHRNNSLIITLKNYGDIPESVLSALKLKINGREQSVDFETAANDNGVFTIELKNPYEYITDEPIEIFDAYNYDFDLNFYDLDYFDGLEFTVIP